MNYFTSKLFLKVFFPLESCKDLVNTCAYYSKFGLCKKDVKFRIHVKKWMVKNCKKTCGKGSKGSKIWQFTMLLNLNVHFKVYII